MKIHTFLSITGISSIIFGLTIFIFPAEIGNWLVNDSSSSVASVLTGMGSLIIGSGCINFSFRKIDHPKSITILLWTNIIAHALGLFADLKSLLLKTGAFSHFLPIILVHLFVITGSIIYLKLISKKRSKAF